MSQEIAAHAVRDSVPHSTLSQRPGGPSGSSLVFAHPPPESTFSRPLSFPSGSPGAHPAHLRLQQSITLHLSVSPPPRPMVPCPHQGWVSILSPKLLASRGHHIHFWGIRRALNSFLGPARGPSEALMVGSTTPMLRPLSGSVAWGLQSVWEELLSGRR